jgi:MFS family permease
MFIVLMREAVSNTEMTALLGRRNLSLNVAVIFSTLILGLWLTIAPFPHNYTAMFVVAFVFALVSMWHVSRTRSIFVAPPAEPKEDQPKISPWREATFREVLYIAFITHVAIFAIAPVVTVYLFDYMGADEQFMAFFVMAELVMAAIVSMLVTPLAKKFGNRAIIAPAMVATAASSAVIALAPNLTMTLFGAVIMGLSWTVASVGVFGYFSEKASTTHSTAYSRAYNQTIFSAMFVGPLIGSNIISDQISIVTVLMLGAGLRLFAGVFIHFRLHRVFAVVPQLWHGLHRPVRVRSTKIA